MRLSTKLYSCIISPDISRHKAALIAVAGMFADSIEVIEEGVLFDVSGLERLIGKPDLVARKIQAEMQRQKVVGSIAVADTVDTAMLLARSTSPRVSKGDSALSVSPSLTVGLVQPDMFDQLPVADLAIERDTLNVFNELGIRSVKDLLAVPHDDLVGRYGKSFQNVIDVLEQKGQSFVTPNVKENKVYWNYHLDNYVEDFEQLIFLLNHGLDKLFGEVAHCGFSTEHLDISFRLSGSPRFGSPHVSKGNAGANSPHANKDVSCTSPRVSKGETSGVDTKTYEIKTSFPTLERAFWLKFINLRISLDPPEASIKGVDVTAHFTKPRPSQRGLYAVSRPEPESLLLTVNKLKKLVGEENVGVPVLLNQRLAKPFKLDADAMPDVRTDRVRTGNDSDRGFHSGTIALTYFRPPLRAEVLVRDGRLVFIKTNQFSNYVAACSGVWKGNSHWWNRSWKTQEWDIEIENGGVYRLSKTNDDWFLTGEYD